MRQWKWLFLSVTQINNKFLCTPFQPLLQIWRHKQSKQGEAALLHKWRPYRRYLHPPILLIFNGVSFTTVSDLGSLRRRLKAVHLTVLNDLSYKKKGLIPKSNTIHTKSRYYGLSSTATGCSRTSQRPHTGVRKPTGWRPVTRGRQRRSPTVGWREGYPDSPGILNK